MAHTYDYSELSSPISYSQAKQIAPPRVNSRWIATVFTLSVYTALMLFGYFRELGRDNTNPAFLGMATLTFAGIIACFYVYRSQTIKAARLMRFAEKNGLQLLINKKPLERDPLLFGLGDQRSVLFGLRDSSTGIEMGQYRYITGANLGAKIWQYTYATFPSSEEWPNMYVHSMKNNARRQSTNDVAKVAKKMQKANLGETFDRYFETYTLDSLSSIRLPEPLKKWMLANGKDYDYIFTGYSILFFRRGYVRFTKPQDLEKLSNLLASFELALTQPGTATSRELIASPKPAIHAGDIRAGIYGTGYVVMGAVMVYLILKVTMTIA